MAQINLVRIELQNFLSYGANLTSLDFSNGLTWIRGTNGNGKSTILEAIHFAFFGEAYRNIKLQELINSYNMRRLLVQLEFDRVSSGTTTRYKVVRGLAPKKFEIYVKEASDSDYRKIPTEAVAGNFQAYLQDSILGFNATLSKNAITMSAMASTPFLTMKTDEKRKFMDSILGMGDLKKIQKAFAEEISSTRTEFKVHSDTLPSKVTSLENLKSILNNAISEKQRGIDELVSDKTNIQSEITILLDELKNLQVEQNESLEKGKNISKKAEEHKDKELAYNKAIARIETISREIEQKKSRINKLKLDLAEYDSANEEVLQSLNTQKESLQADLVKYNNNNIIVAESTVEIKHLTNQIEKLNSELLNNKVGVECPTCGKPTTEDDVNKVKSELTSNLNALNKKLKDIEKTKNKAEKVLLELGQINNKLSDVDKQLSNVKLLLAKKSSSLNELESISTALKTLDIDYNDNTAIRDELKSIIPEINKINVDLNKARSEYTEVKSKVDVKKNSISEKERLIQSIDNKIEAHKKSNVDSVIANTEAKINSTNLEIEECKRNIKESSDKVQMLKYIQEIFGDDGIKEYMMKKYVPVLNQSVKKILNRFNLSYQIEFDSNMEVTFNSPIGSAKCYEALSGGQRVRVDFSIYMAFREFVNKIGRFGINVLFLDELLDTAVDADGLSDMISIVKDIVTDVGCVYLISHRVEALNEEVDSIYEVSHDGTFSTLNMIR